jgi:hypothetical protein
MISIIISQYDTIPLNKVNRCLVGDIINKMRIVDGNGQRLYLKLMERKRFIESSKNEVRENRMFCHILHVQAVGYQKLLN